MDAELLLRRTTQVADGIRVERVLWLLPAPARGSRHSDKYRYALIVDDVCVMRYDNEAGKGDHKHFDDEEVRYAFVDAATLLDDFLADVRRWRREHSRN